MTTAPRFTTHWIDGQITADDAESRSSIMSPLDGSVVADVALGDAERVDQAVASARAAQGGWADVAPVQRGRVLRNLARAIRAAGPELVDMECEETGKLRAEMNVSLEDAAEYFEYYGGIIRSFSGETIDLGAGQHAFTSREPHGVVGVITPWNSPLTQAARSLAPALAVGNAVVAKPSVFTPSTTVRLAELASEVGLPPGVLNVVTGSGQTVGEGLVTHPDVDKISFTGSVEAGRHVAQLAAARFVPATLELGGKSANLVFADADLDAAVTSALSIVRFAGQVCAALSRLLVEESIYEEMVDRVAARMQAMTPGVDVAPLTTSSQARTVADFFEKAREEGLTLRAGGSSLNGGSSQDEHFVRPTLFADVPPTSELFQQEIFGPVLTVTPFADEQEAVRLANGTEYELVAAVWTRDLSRALRLSRRLRAGQVVINGGRTGVDTPFGGQRASGIGREKGLEALKDNTRVKTTVIGIR